MCLLALAVSIKPLANTVADYTCCDRDQKVDEEFHSVHLLPVASLEKGSAVIVSLAA